MGSFHLVWCWWCFTLPENPSCPLWYLYSVVHFEVEYTCHGCFGRLGSRAMSEVKDGVMMSCNSASTVRRMLSHMIGILVAIATSLLGFGLFVVLAGVVGWVDPIWWGGKALFFPILGAPCVAISAIVLHIVMTWLRNASSFKEFSYVLLVAGEALVGFLFFPCFCIITFALRTVPGIGRIWPYFNIYLSIGLGLAMTSFLAVAFSCAIVLSWLRVKKVSPRSGDNP